MRALAGCKTGIIASIGRTFCAPRTLREGIQAGALNFRLPLGLHDRDLVADFRAIRQAARELDVEVNVLLDLPAARPRTGDMPARTFQPGQRAHIVDPTVSGPPGPAAIPLPGLEPILPNIAPGHRLVFRDGRQEFRVLHVDPAAGLDIECLVCAEPLRAANGCSFPDTGIRFDSVRPQDNVLLEQMAKQGLRPDWVAVSLVTEAAQLGDVRSVLAKLWPKPPVRVMAKIETADAVEHLGPILDESDGCLLGRGDLGLNMAPETIPRVQENVANEARSRVKLFTVATQILERFAETGVPYRAELSDIALAVRQGAAGIVLCQETNDSSRPVACIELAQRVIAAESR